MAKKKRRGRPPGSKNKKRPAKSVVNMDVAQLRSYISGLQDTLAAKVQQQREYFESQLAGLRVYADNKVGAAARSLMGVSKTRKRSPAKPKYRSKKQKSLKWSGRGLMPVWMREEMKGTKLTKDDFLIK